MWHSAGAATGEEAWQQAWSHPLIAALTGQACMPGGPNRPSQAFITSRRSLYQGSAGSTATLPEVTEAEVGAAGAACSGEGGPSQLLRLHVTVYALPPLLMESPAALQALMGRLLAVQPASVQVSSPLLRPAFRLTESGFASPHMHACSHLCACRGPC